MRQARSIEWVATPRYWNVSHALDFGGHKRVWSRFQDYSREIFDWISAGFGDRVFETVLVLSVNDVDGHFTGEPYQFFSARIRDDSHT